MLDAMSTHAPRRPKLRSSCDGCGAAKLKCDRGQPECGRCVSLGLVCVYGVSRKTGKPPRDRIRSLSSVSRPGDRSQNICATTTTNNNIENLSAGITDDYTCGAPRSIGDELSLDTGTMPIDVPSTWNSVENYHHDSLSIGVDDQEILLHHEYQRPSLSDFGALNMDEDIFSSGFDIGPFPSVGSPKSIAASQTMAAQCHINGSLQGRVDMTSLQQQKPKEAAGKGHDCPQIARNILNSLSFADLNQASHIPRSTPSSSSTPSITGSITQQVPLDHILRLNRESCEKISQLLMCPCSRCPDSVLLYASVISRILLLYQEAAGYPAQMDLLGLTSASSDTSLGNLWPQSGSTSGSSSPWSSTTSTTVNGIASSDAGSSAFAIAPSQVVIGSFKVDDLQVQAALKIQLLFGEVRRVGRLIELFASRSSIDSIDADDFTISDVTSLYKSLSLWLRREHSRITEGMRSRLKDATR